MNGKLLLVLAGAMLWPLSGVTAEVEGRIWIAQNGQNKAAAGAKVFIECSGISRDSSTDSRGVYTVSSSGSGKCWAYVEMNEKPSNKIRLLVSSNGTRANFELRKKDDYWSVTLK